MSILKQKQLVINQMTQHKFPFMGVMRSMGEYFDGYGYAAGIAMFVIVLLLWITSNNFKGNETYTKKILLCICLSLYAWSIDEFIFFSCSSKY